MCRTEHLCWVPREYTGEYAGFPNHIFFTNRKLLEFLNLASLIRGTKTEPGAQTTKTKLALAVDQIARAPQQKGHFVTVCVLHFRGVLQKCPGFGKRLFEWLY